MSRTGAIFAVLGLFAVGVLSGALGVHLYYAHLFRSHEPPPWADRGPMVMALSNRLDLTPDQQRQLERIFVQARIEGEALRRELRPRIQAQMERTRERIERILTPEQRAEFERMHAEHRHWADRLFLEPPPPGPDGMPPGRRFQWRHRN